LTDISSLSLPNLYHHNTQQQHEESRNDHENNSAGTVGTSSMQSTANPCFKTDASLHHLPSHTVSLKAPSMELVAPPQPQHRRTCSNRSTANSAPIIAVASDNASIESALTVDDMWFMAATSQNQHHPLDSSNNTCDLHSTVSAPVDLAERTEQILMEARRQSSRSNVVNQRTDDIIREARLAAAAASAARRKRGWSIGSVGAEQSSVGIRTSHHSAATRRNSNNASSSDLDSSQREEMIQQALDRASEVSKAAAAHAVLTGSAISKRQQSPVSSSRSPLPQYLPETEKETKENDDEIKVALSSESIQTEPLKSSEDESKSVRLFRTQSSEEVLELAQSLLDEAKAQLEDSPTRQTAFPSPPHRKAASKQPLDDAFLTPPHQKPKDDATGGSTAAEVATPNTTSNAPPLSEFQIMSPSDSDIASLDDFDKAIDKLPSRFTEEGDNSMSREKILRKLDDMPTHKSTVVESNNDSTVTASRSDVMKHFEDDVKSEPGLSAGSMPHIGRSFSFGMKQAPVKPVVIKSLEVKQQPDDVNTIGSWFNFFMRTKSKDAETEDQMSIEAFPVSCGSASAAIHDHIPLIGSSLVKASNMEPMPPSYPEVVLASRKTDPKLQQWVENKFKQEEQLPQYGNFRLGESKSIVVHEILRGNWTWSTAWSPDGKRLAIATENHHLAVVETTSSSVWRVKHDRRTKGPPKKGTTHSIRSIAWGDHFIAIGGTGNAVSILAPTDPYPILHTITPTGFVGSIDWLPGTDTLLIGSRLGKAMLVNIWTEEHKPGTTQVVRDIQSTVLHMIDREKAWINAVQFSADRSHFAVGDSKGILGVYSFKYDLPGSNNINITNVANFKLEDSVLDVEWSPDGQYLYAAGEDFAITVITTQHWEPVHRIKRDRWVQFISSSHGSSHVAVGGVNTEVSILEVNKGWENVINIGLKGLVPLSAKWHPDDQYLVLTGQSNSVLAIETTNARHVSGHFLRSVYAIKAIAFSPDSRMAAVGNEMGIVSIFKLTDTTFTSVYEMVVDCEGSVSLEWSQNGAYVAVAAGNKVVIVARTETLPGSAPPNTSGFFVAKVVRDLGEVHDVSIEPTSRFLAVSGSKTRVLDATAGFKTVLEMENGGTTLANAWSPNGQWFAVIGVDHSLVIYDTSPMNLSQWQSVFTVKTNQAGLAVAWGPSSIEGLQYCAYGGEDKHISIVEIRTKERTWETVLDIPREGHINDLDWNCNGLVAAAIGNGTATILDLSYLQSGFAVNEMDYNWQRQALTCFTEIRRNRGKHSMKAVRWLPSPPGSDNLMACGGTDGELEILDLTERKRCRGYRK
jgi:WD40 repeat protein